jgi:hypothetical protein
MSVAHRQMAAGLLFVCFALGSAACQRMLDMGRLQSLIQSGLTEQLGLPFKSVSCPENRDMKAGDVFQCKAVAETGGDLTIEVTQKDDSGNVNWKAVDAERVMSLAKLEEQIKEGLARQLKVEAAVTCGDSRMRIAIAGATLECTATAGNESRAVAVTMDDDKGNVTWTLK